MSTEQDKAFSEALDRLIPKSLDTVITQNRNHAELRVATPVDLEPLRAIVPYNEHLVQTIENWTLITLDWHPPHDEHRVWTMLLGYNRSRGEEWHTSKLERYDPGTGCLITYSGTLYRVVGPSSDDPDLLRVCAVLHGMRVGKYLGAMHIYY
jgi:hypothetical protein